ncbi:hypothetical protein EVAR_5212_1 [Eumeta japonica]|uniref:Uncharacterized protein n=1 Tax=Eumeta variegata TaxID=151549 RepID=A0A4C1V4Q5_EUMVA|nr:hypothetical protein EVAR_5212_1 [Eumeta japonica]
MTIKRFLSPKDAAKQRTPHFLMEKYPVALHPEQLPAPVTVAASQLLDPVEPAVFFRDVHGYDESVENVSRPRAWEPVDVVTPSRRIRRKLAGDLVTENFNVHCFRWANGHRASMSSVMKGEWAAETLSHQTKRNSESCYITFVFEYLNIKMGQFDLCCLTGRTDPFLCSSQVDHGVALSQTITINFHRKRE